MAAFNVRMKEEDKLVLDDITKKAGMSQTEFMKHVVQLYQNLGMAGIGLAGQTIKPTSLNPEQTAILENAVAITGGSIEDFMIDASIARAEQVVKLSTYSSEELKNIPNSASIRINSAVLELIERNKKAVEWYEKTELTQGKVFEATGSNRAAIRKYFAENEKMIREHNQSLKLQPNHNTKAAVYLLQLEKSKNA